MEQTWRWFGPGDPVTLADARQAGAEGIVTALHHLEMGAVWPVEEIVKRQEMVAAAGMRWSVVESLDVTERIKTRSAGWQQDIAAFQQSLRNLAACGIRTVAYNLMPVFSWMRTHLEARLAHGGSAVRFDATAFAAFDLYLLKRAEAEAEWGEARCQAAHAYFDALTELERDELQATILQGLPGGNRAFSMDEVRHLLDEYREIDRDGLRANAGAFLAAVCPVAEEVGVRLGVHPDDPPRPLLGLPRIVSTADDLDFLLAQSPEPANGITFCTGALGVRADNDLVAMAKRFGPRIWFAHLRSTQREVEFSVGPEIESFYEAAHLEGDADLIGVVEVLVREEQQRVQAGDIIPLPFRPDHGQQLLNDHERHAHPGYPAIGRLRGLAELRGVMLTTQRHLAQGRLG